MKPLFQPEPRICIVSKTEIVRDDSHNNGPLRFTTKETKCRALFHRFATIERPIEASPLKGGHPGGQYSKPVAIIEYEDGTVHMVGPESVRFLDTKELMEQYAWNEDQERDCLTCKHNEDGTNRPCRKCETYSEWEESGNATIS